jgi:UDP-N-acetylmuramoylalanine--D-glutamate ligase
MSSFQLDGIKTFKPEIGILLNITPDHLDRYEYSLDNYINSKFQLIQNMGNEQYFVYYVNDPIIEREVNKRTLIPKQVPVSLLPSSKAPIPF